MRIFLRATLFALALLSISVGISTPLNAQSSSDDPVDRLTKACESKDYFGCAMLAAVYESGSGGVKKDMKKALELYTTACDGGNNAGCNTLADLYQTGKGVPKDLTKAMVLVTKSCDAKSGEGCARLGNYYFEGRAGTPKDEAKGVELYTKACDLESGLGCSNLGYAYKSGKGVAKDHKKAEELRAKARKFGFNPPWK